MLVLLLTFVLILLTLAVLFWVGSLLAQGYFYENVAPDLYWRAPAAALAVTFFLALFCLIARKSEGSVNSLFTFSPTKEERFTRFTALRAGKEEQYEKDSLKNEFLTKPGKKAWIWNNSDGVVDTIIVPLGEDRLVFKADLTADNKPKDGKNVIFRESGGQGRVIKVEELGIITKERPGVTFVNFVLNFLHLAIWFLALWLLLQFQWLHALLLAVPLWLAMTLILLPSLVEKAVS